MTTSDDFIKGILSVAKAFFATLDRDLADPDIKVQYQDGSKDDYVKSVLVPLTLHTAEKILEKQAIAGNGDPVSQLAQRELEMVAAVYYEIVTAAYDLAKIRTSDLTATDGLAEVLEGIRSQMAGLTKVSELDELRNNLSLRTQWYADKPNLMKNVQAGAATLSAAYAVYPSKQVSEYQTMEILAEPQTLSVVNAMVAALPSGLELDPSNGMIFVGNRDALARGSHSVNVTTADDKGGLTTHTLNIKLGLDQPVVYQVASPMKVDSLKDGDNLATVYDATRVAKADLIEGALPPGVLLDLLSGSVYVFMENLLRPGSWAATVRTLDVDQDEAIHTLSFSILADVEASYSVAETQSIDEYENGAVIATAIDADGNISTASVTGLPPGIEMDPTSGALLVSNQALLEPGNYLVNISLTTSSGRTETHVIEVMLGADEPDPAYYVINSPLSISDYQNETELARVLDPMEPVVFAKLLSPSLPAGVRLDTNDGRLLVENSTLLFTGKYPLKISSTNVYGFTTTHDINLQIGIAPVYYNQLVKPADRYEDGDRLASLIVPGTPLAMASQVGGSLPFGIQLDQQNGDIFVSAPGSLLPANFSVIVEVTDVQEVAYTVAAHLEIGANSGMTYGYAPVKPVNLYKEGERIGWITTNAGEVVSARVAKGILPRGISLNNVNGTLTVSDPSKLFPGTYIGAEIEIRDLFGTQTNLPLSIRLLPVPEIVYEVIPTKPANMVSEGESLFFISQGAEILAGAQIIGGKLPDGTSFDMLTGEVVVYDPNLILPGDFDPVILTISQDGMEKEHQLYLTLLQSSSAVQEGPFYTTIATLTAAENYAGSQVATLDNGQITSSFVSTKVLSGTMPAGLILDTTNANIVVDDPAALVAVGPQISSNLMIEVRYADQSVFAVPLPLSFTVETNSEPTGPPAATYDTSLVPFIQSIYGAPEMTLSLDAGSLTGALSLQADWTLSFQDSASIAAGLYQLTLLVQTPQVPEGTHPVELLLSSPDKVPGYFLNRLLSIRDLIDGAYLAIPVFLNVALSSAGLVGGEPPAGMTLDPNSGILKVVQASLLEPGSYQFQVRLVFINESFVEYTFDLGLTQ